MIQPWDTMYVCMAQLESSVQAARSRHCLQALGEDTYHKSLCDACTLAFELLLVCAAVGCMQPLEVVCTYLQVYLCGLLLLTGLTRLVLRRCSEFRPLRKAVEELRSLACLTHMEMYACTGGEACG